MNVVEAKTLLPQPGIELPFLDCPACSLISVNASQHYGYVLAQLKVSSRTGLWVEDSHGTLFSVANHQVLHRRHFVICKSFILPKIQNTKKTAQATKDSCSWFTQHNPVRDLHF